MTPDLLTLAGGVGLFLLGMQIMTDALRTLASRQMRAILSRLATLGTEFSQNVLKDEADWSMILGPDDLGGLPPFLVQAARAEAGARGAEGWAITLSRSSIEPFLTFSTRRDLRERAWRAWVARGTASNWPLVAEMVRLRVERAKLLGFPDFASFKLADEMAKGPDAVREAFGFPAREGADV